MYSKSSIASDPTKTRGRLFKEPAPYERSEFQRDRDRVIHSSAFRRLEYKTQVFVNHEGDHYRTRLTHSLEVSQIARSIARALGLDEDLAESIALAHDLGHTPFGHAGEDALKTVYPEFEHNAQTIKIVTRLEQKYAEFDGLNLTWETLEGIAKHNGPIKMGAPRIIREYNRFYNLELDSYPSLEAQIASLADDIAYCNHDLDDGLRANLFTIEDMLELPLVGHTFREIQERYPDISAARIIHESTRRMISAMVRDLLVNTKKRIYEFAIRDPQDVRKLGQSLARFSPEMEEINHIIKEWLTKNMYRHYKVNRMTTKAKKTVIELFNFFITEPGCLPTQWQKKAEKTSLHEVVADYIAGMTDRFALEEHEKIFG